ncbi:hypothetical protein EYF80_014132 [Liparis tanakae]|uniref:Uncharacterized protein n=1 Tax=Liparis tanakae TaxID=230148 RepID=A0A4Z2ICH5_9TELE|nr:hypothetical protein EYF80_014132 [Liparis tanakae]
MKLTLGSDKGDLERSEMVRPEVRRVQRESAGSGRPSFSHRMVGFGYPDAMQGNSTTCPTWTSPDWKLSSSDGVDSVGAI